MTKKTDLLAKAARLKLKVTAKNTVAQIEEAIKNADTRLTVVDTKISQEEPKLAKAGKRSVKGLKAEEEKQTKIEHQEHTSEEKTKEVTAKPKKPIKPARPRTERRAKGYKESAKLLDKTKSYTLKEALELAVKTSHVKFDASVEMHIRMNVDPRQADQNIRDTLLLPSGSGKTVRVAVFAEDDDAKKAKTAGADIAGNETFLQQLDKGVFDFDVLVSTPAQMAKLGKYARVLGPKGLMPNPKSGTVTTDVVKAVKEAKAGKLDYRVDESGIVHCAIGKVSFGAQKIQANADVVMASILNNKPTSLKGAYIKSLYVTTAMGPSIQVVTVNEE